MAGAALPSKSASVIAERNRSLILPSIASTASWWKMHEAGVDGTILYETVGDIATLDGIAILGTTTTIWSARPGWFTPDVTAQNSWATAEQGADSLCALDTLTAGGLLAVFEVNITSNPASGLDQIFHYGSNGAGGQYGIQLQYGANANLKVTYQPVGGTQATRSINITADIGNDIICAVYYDVSNDNIEVFANTSTSVSQAMTVDGTARPGTTMTAVNRKLGIFCRPVALDQKFGSSGALPTVRDLFMIRFETDQSAQLASIIQGFIDNPTDLPWALEGL